MSLTHISVNKCLEYQRQFLILSAELESESQCYKMDVSLACLSRFREDAHWFVLLLLRSGHVTSAAFVVPFKPCGVDVGGWMRGRPLEAIPWVHIKVTGWKLYIVVDLQIARKRGRRRRLMFLQMHLISLVLSLSFVGRSGEGHLLTFFPWEFSGNVHLHRRTSAAVT